MEYFLNKFCPPKLQKYVEIATNAILMFFFVAIIISGFPFAIDQWSMRATAANIPKTIPFIAIPVSITFMLVHTAARTLTLISSLARPASNR